MGLRQIIKYGILLFLFLTGCPGEFVRNDPWEAVQNKDLYVTSDSIENRQRLSSGQLSESSSPAPIKDAPLTVLDPLAYERSLSWLGGPGIRKTSRHIPVVSSTEAAVSVPVTASSRRLSQPGNHVSRAYDKALPVTPGRR